MIVQLSQPLQKRNKVICNNVILTCISTYFFMKEKLSTVITMGVYKGVSYVKTIQVDRRLRITETVSSTEF